MRSPSFSASSPDARAGLTWPPLGTSDRFLQDIASCKVFKAHSGGASHFALAQDHTNDALTLSIAFGQGTIHSGASRRRLRRRRALETLGR